MAFNSDIVILLILAIFFLMGFVRGFIKQIGSIAGFFLALWIAATYHPAMAEYLKPSFAQWQIIAQQLSVVAAYGLLFFGTQFAFGIIVSIADYMFRIFSFAPFMKFTNRFLGGFIGMLEGILLVSAAVFLIIHFPFAPKLAKQLQESRFIPVINTVNTMLTPLLPDASKLPASLPSIIDPKNINLDQLKNIDPSKLNIDMNSKEYQQLKGFFDEILKQQENAKTKEKTVPGEKKK